MARDNEDDDLEVIETQHGARVPYALVREAMAGEPYDMNLAGRDIEHVTRAVNMGIDSHLEACYCPDRGDAYTPTRGQLGPRMPSVVSPESFPVLVRRLYELAYADELEPGHESDGEGPADLADIMLMTLGIDPETGKLVGRKALGLD